MFISQAFAETVNKAASQPSSMYVILMNLVPFILIFAVFYFILIMPQKRKQANLRKMLESLKHGDKVVLSSGIVGKIVRVKDDGRVIIKTHETTEIEVLKSFISNIIND